MFASIASAIKVGRLAVSYRELTSSACSRSMGGLGALVIPLSYISKNWCGPPASISLRKRPSESLSGMPLAILVSSGSAFLSSRRTILSESSPGFRTKTASSPGSFLSESLAGDVVVIRVELDAEPVTPDHRSARCDRRALYTARYRAGP